MSDTIDVVERIKTICKNRGIALSRLERDCGFANAYMTNLRAGKMPADRLQKVADYLQVSTRFLLTGEEETYYINPETARSSLDRSAGFWTFLTSPKKYAKPCFFHLFSWNRAIRQ